MGKIIDLTGKKFGILIVVERVFIEGGKGAYWKCKCECTGTKIVKSKNLVGGKTTHCGCVNKHQTHGMSDHRLHRIWLGMKARCNNQNSKDYLNYGGRGIKICEDWEKNFINFYNWAMNNGYKENLSIDRIDTNGNYEPENCKWSTGSEQQNNKRNTRYVEINGVTKSIQEWAEIVGVNKRTIWRRYINGVKDEDLLKLPNMK